MYIHIEGLVPPRVTCEVGQPPPSPTSQITRGGTSPRYEFRSTLFKYDPPSPARLDVKVQACALERGGTLEKACSKFVPRARPTASYLRSGGWGWLAHYTLQHCMFGVMSGSRACGGPRAPNPSPPLGAQTPITPSPAPYRYTYEDLYYAREHCPMIVTLTT